MLVRLDKEYSDITYIPTNSLGMQIAELCKRNHQHRNPEDALHGRPYYDHKQQIKQFDESSLGSSLRVESNPELLAQLQAEMDERKRKEKQDQEEKRRMQLEVEKREMQEKIRAVSADSAAIKNALKGGSNGGNSGKNGAGGDGGGTMFAIAAVIGGGAYFASSKGSSQTPSQASPIGRSTR